ncbi:MAG: hypothetical protein LUG51_00495 [Tannerellaceae bacterium]|nr:hypothetical protein [Tannerellaceae bacterium]
MVTLVTKAAIVSDGSISLEILDRLISRQLLTEYQFEDKILFNRDEVEQYQHYENLYFIKDNPDKKEIIANILNHNPTPDQKNPFYFFIDPTNRILYELVINDLVKTLDYPKFADIFKEVFLTGNPQKVAFNKNLSPEIVLYAYSHIRDELKKLYGENE